MLQRILILYFLAAHVALADEPCILHWERLPGPPGGEVLRLARAADGTLYAGHHVGGVYRSTNNGATWEKAWVTRTDHGKLRRQGEIRALGVIGNDVFAGDWFSPQSFMVSYDRGTKWKSTFSDKCVPNCLTVAADSSLYLGCEDGGIFHSTDRGEHWKHIGLAIQPIASIAVRPDGMIAAAGVDGTLYLSRGAGMPWEPHPLSTMLQEVSWTSRGTLLVASHHDGVLRSTNEGRTWDRVLAPDSMALTVACNGVRCYAGIYDEGLFTSSDDGETWRSLPNHGPHPVVKCILIIDSLELFAGTWSAGVFHSTDGGTTWMHSSEGMSESGGPGYTWESLVCTSRGTLMYVWGYSGIWRSTDHGRHWQISNPGYFERPVTSIVEARGLGLFASTKGTIVRSTDDGASWTIVWKAAVLDSGCRIITGEPNAVYVAAVDRLWRSSDGRTFRCIDSSSGGWPNDARIVHFVDSTGALFRFIADSKRFERSIDKGRTWTMIAIPAGNVRDACAYPGSKILLVTTAGAFASADHGTTWQSMALPPGSLGIMPSIGKSRESFIPLSTLEMIGMGREPNLIEYTSDGGASWRACDDGIDAYEVDGIVMTRWGEPIVVTWGGLFRGVWDRGERGK